MALGGIPLLVISLDVLTNRRITNYLRELLFTPERTQIFEPRDVIWAWAMLAFGGFLVLWGLKELFMPTKVIECRPEGLALKVAGPGNQPAVVPWSDISDVQGDVIVDEGQKIPILAVQLYSVESVPPDPWGARWVAERELGILAQDWSDTPEVVAARVISYKSEQGRRASRDAVASLWTEQEGKGEEE